MIFLFQTILLNYLCLIKLKIKADMRKMIAWVEIPTINFERGVDFYRIVFNMELEPLDFGTEKMACFPSGEGAVIFAPGYKPSDRGVLVSLHVADDIESTVARIEAHGGKVLIPKTKIEAEGRGYFAVFLDPEGNKLGLYED